MPAKPLRVIFAGTPEFAATHLRALLDSPHTIVAVYTQPDRRAGRGKKLQASPVKLCAREAGLAVEQPPGLRDPAAQAHLTALQADVMVVVAYGLLLPQPVLEAPRFGCINVHASLLPRWRGAAPIQRAIAAGDRESGITIMQMDAGLDTGAMLATARCPIGPRTTAAGLHDSLAKLGPPLLLSVLADLPAALTTAVPQNDAAATYAHKLTKAEANLDWHLDAATLARAVRAFNPFPVCYSSLRGERVRIWQATALEDTATGLVPGTIVRADSTGIVVACGEGALRLEVLQLAGGKPLDSGELLHARAALFGAGEQFDPPAPEPG
ncbi:methionyl-tRNA formyltransferase [Kineobactrum salinum]|uniref:Methionyl-tRNA formyltransferase n=1 Tax=Kineobactrum salinum TaxID=2708301 RepID=A0A6C0U2G7_9GAMM|nr:methionyl-tRNA formyltransferase [Kineobactrum salinum]QIB65659.1 methionyl-tRNA formyltransferase [Kineobactrum salinum]